MRSVSPDKSTLCATGADHKLYMWQLSMAWSSYQLNQLQKENSELRQLLNVTRQESEATRQDSTDSTQRLREEMQEKFEKMEKAKDAIDSRMRRFLCLPNVMDIAHRLLDCDEGFTKNFTKYLNAWRSFAAAVSHPQLLSNDTARERLIEAGGELKAIPTELSARFDQFVFL